jgi:hypothetical protein
MQAYIGSKIILAEECSKETFEENKKNGFPVEFDFENATAKPDETGRVVTLGYHVVYSNPDGSKYHSWSPKNVFDRSYRRIETDEKELISTY